MLGFITRRTLLAIPVLLGIIVVVFFLIRAIPGDPCTSLLGERATEEACERFDAANGLNEPIWVQLGIYMKNVMTFNLGESVRFSRPVNQLLIERLPLTIELAFSALTIAVVIGIPMGIIAARKHNTAIDSATMAFANVGVSMPVFWLGLMLAYVFALVLKDTPFALPPSGRLTAGVFSIPYYEVWAWDLKEGGFWSTFHEFIANFYIFNSLITAQWAVFKDATRHMVLPAIALATIPLAIIARITRSSLLEVMSKDYIRTARAKVPRNRGSCVVTRYGTRFSPSSPSSVSRSAGCWGVPCLRKRCSASPGSVELCSMPSPGVTTPSSKDSPWSSHSATSS